MIAIEVNLYTCLIASFRLINMSLVVYRISTRACHSYGARESGVRLPARELDFFSTI